jgi:fibronectin type 3 domain-containing protein
VQSNKSTATAYGLQLFAYEGGPGNTNGGANSTTNVGVQILANRDPGMDALVQTHIRNNWFQQGGNMFGYFVMSSAYSRYGDWGATDDYTNLTTAKYNALVQLTGYEPAGVPFAPGDLVATAGNNAVGLVWQPVPGAANYNVMRGAASGGETFLATVSSSTYQDTTVTNGNTYYYEVTGMNSTGTGVPSNEAYATPEAAPPPAPVLSATPGNAQVVLTWTTAPGAASYDVYEGAAAGGESATPIETGITATSYTVTGLTNGTPYYFEVAGVNSGGTGADSNEVSATPASPPAAPTGLTAAAGVEQAVLTWTAVSGAASYNVYQGTATGQEGATPIATGITAATYTVTGLTDGTQYFFTVAAVSPAGTSGFSNEATATPSGTYTLAATTPAGITPGASATSTITVSSTTGYSGTVTLTCALTTSPSGATDLPTCSVPSTAVSMGGTATATVSTTGATSELIYPKLGGHGRGWAGTGGAVLAFLVFLGIPARRRGWRSMLGALVLMAALGSLAACGGSSSGGGGSTGSTGTTSGSYTFTVTGTGSPAVTPAPTATFSVTVN